MVEERALLGYLRAKSIVLAAGYEAEIEWQEAVGLRGISETDFIREAAWVVLSSGMRERVIRDCFDRVSTAFLQWRSASAIWANRATCRLQALRHFANQRKIDAVLSICGTVATESVESLIDDARVNGLGSWQRLPYVGPVTVMHLAKNLGFMVSKPDRHLVRLARALAQPSVSDMCEAFSRETGDSVPVVDLVLWRFATLVPDYVSFFSSGRGSRFSLKSGSNLPA